ncbi:MAG: radical SAM protein [Pseudomonadota bacterium]
MSARQKFNDPHWTARGERRAVVPMGAMRTVWFNTGSLCNIECANCYMESSPTHDALQYISRAEARMFLDEIKGADWPVQEIGFTGGEPFLNPDMAGMARDALTGGWRVLILTNAMRPLMRPQVQADVEALAEEFGDRLTFRVSLDHFTEARHNAERGAGAWAEALRGASWLAALPSRLALAGRYDADEAPEAAREGYRQLIKTMGWSIDVDDPERLSLFPEMRADDAPPEITEACWEILGVSPSSVMCSSSRMIVKPKGAAAPRVRPCTLLPYGDAFDLGETLAGSLEPTPLNHPYCATFCVLGGASCGAAT